MFLDKAKIKVVSGSGGNGAATFRREKFVAYGGPDGADGGKGGSVFIEATTDMNTLLDFQYQSAYKAESGEKGAKRNCFGKCGEDLTIRVPCGTVIKDEKEGITIADLINEGDKVMVASGGRGGKGNAKFKTNANRIPTFCEPGEPGIERELTLELKMIADVGIIGYPNAGKSTLISKISAAKPKIADYAFTTIEPNLGVVKKPQGDAFVVADIPGLIEGASDGVGLGHEFLRHVERTRLLVHVIDIWGFDKPKAKDNRTESLFMKVMSSTDPICAYYNINTELKNYSAKLADKPQIIVLNKIEAYPEEELQEMIKKLEEVISLEKDINILGFHQISAATGEGTEGLKNFIAAKVDELPEDFAEVVVDHDPIAEDHDDSRYSIEQAAPDYWNIYCGKLERIIKITNIRDRESLAHLFRVAKSMGVFSKLVHLGADIGHTLNIDGIEFEIDETTLV